MKRAICFVFAAFLAISATVHGQAKEKRRGKYLRTEIRKTDRRNDFSVELVASQLGMPVLQFKKFTILTHHEVRIYEMLVEIVRDNAGQGITERGAVEYVLVPDEVYEGEQSTREETEGNAPFADAELEASIGNTQWSITTDKEGKYIDSSQRILDVFDNLRIKSEELVVKHKDLGSKSLELTRNLLKREAANMPDVERQATSDILEAFGQDYTQLRSSSEEGIRTSAIAPAKAKAGDMVAITVEVKNDGAKPACNLMGRCFSADSGLNGKMFYFGSIQPGAKASFTRLVKMPDTPNRVCYAAIGFWTILGTAQNKECRMSIEILP